MRQQAGRVVSEVLWCCHGPERGRVSFLSRLRKRLSFSFPMFPSVSVWRPGCPCEHRGEYEPAFLPVSVGLCVHQVRGWWAVPAHDGVCV